jgi:hypothetical protein
VNGAAQALDLHTCLGPELRHEEPLEPLGYVVNIG